MTGKWPVLVVPVLETVGLKRGWGMSTVPRIQEKIPQDLGRLILRQEDINSVLAFGGLSEGKEVASDFPAHKFMLRPDFVVRSTKEYREAAVIGEALLPMLFVHQFVRNEPNFDPLADTWPFLQKELDRAQLECELVMCIARVVEHGHKILTAHKSLWGHWWKTLRLVMLFFTSTQSTSPMAITVWVLR
jgi:hypothetical protein